MSATFSTHPLGSDAETRKRVLLIAMADSIHVARWIEQFDGMPIDFTIFPSGPNRRVHPMIERRLRLKGASPSVAVAAAMTYASFPLGLVDLVIDHRCKAPLLRRLLKHSDFDFIHVLEFQHAGYLLVRALGGRPAPATVIATNWGSDVYWFSQFPDHRRKIQQLLAIADRYSSECARDQRLAKDLGFKGAFLPVNPNAGGIPTDEYRASALANPPSSRTRIAVKGYDRFVGLAPMALEAIESLAVELRDFEIVFYSAGRRMRRLIGRTQARTGLNIIAHPPYALSHSEMMMLFLSSRIYLGVSRSDGISTSLLEAMTTGCFPIQTATSCADEWISPGRSGAVIRELEVDAIVECLRPALEDDELVNRAMAINLDEARSRLDHAAIASQSHAFYV